MTTPTPQTQIRWRVLYSGHVQGVGFRETTRQISSDHDVYGYVKNLPDGRVELVVEGQQRELQGFLDDIQQQLAQRISSHTVDETTASGEFRRFDVRY